MKRFASIWLMDWPITAWRWARPHTARTGQAAPPEADPASPLPFALVERTAHGLVLQALTPAARDRGLKAGQAHADACAIVPDLASAPAEPERALQSLQRLGGWMERFSPFVSLDTPDPSKAQSDGLEGLFVDLTGGQHLFGGEAAMATQMLDGLKRLNAPARIGVADTPGAAWSLARYSSTEIAIAPEGGARDALAALPVAALRLSPQAVHLLTRFGLRRIGMLAELPRAALARRFRDAEALNVLQRLDQAMGAVSEPLVPLTPPPVYRVQKVFFEPMTSAEVIALEAVGLTERLVKALEQDGMGARRLRLTGFRVDGRTTSLEVALAAPSRRARHLLRLFKDKGFEHLDLGFGVDALTLSAPVAEPLVETQTTALGDEQRRLDEAQGALIDRLTARLGEDAVLAPHLTESWLPERAERLKPFASADSATLAADLGPRPILLFDPPEPMEAIAELPDGAPAQFIWRRVAHRVARAAGPERLTPEWWRTGRAKAPRTRDYYRLEDEAGGRYWVFREGLYAGPDSEAPPSWWMHGLFA